MRQVKTAGEMYIRKTKEDPQAETIKWLYSRNPVFQLWKDLPGNIRVLTLPGLEWKLEYKLAKYRRGRVHVTAVEKDRSTFDIAMPLMPKAKLCPVLYEHMTVEQLVAETSWAWTAAWLDFSGHLTTTKVECLRQLWPRLSHSLIVTFLAARADGRITKWREKAGGWAPMIAHEIGASTDRASQSNYHNGTNNLIQVTVVKSGKPPEPPVRYINGIKLEELYGIAGKKETD